MTVAQQFIDVLRQVGVDRIYGVVGDSLNPIVDAIRRTDGIEWVHVRQKIVILDTALRPEPAAA